MNTWFVVGVLLMAMASSGKAAELNLIPWPAKVQQASGQFGLNKRTVVAADGLFTNEATFIAGKLRIACATSVGENRILLTTSGGAGGGGEAYRLEVDRRGVTIQAASPAGAFYGCQTLVQLIDPVTQKIPFVQIEDSPRYAWRGLMLDVSRHFFDTQAMLELLDQMAAYKLNRFHLHLTDDTAWRLEIRKYPELTTIGARGDYSDSNAPPRFYTADDMRRLIACAQQRHILIVPEIEMPGHASAATRSLPQLDGGTHTFNPARQETYDFLQNVLLETMDIFPSPWIHFGGDEVDCSRWIRDLATADELRTGGASTGEQMEAAFAQRVAGFIAAHGRTAMGWDDMVAGGRLTNTVVYWWRHDKPERLTQALASGHPVVLSPRSPFYFDYPQDKSYPQTGWRLINTLTTVYRGPAVPTNIPSAHLKQIMGVEGCVWTERISTVPYLEFMTLPRMAALAENAWTADDQRNFAKFSARLVPFTDHYRERGIHFYDQSDPSGSLRDARKFEPPDAPKLMSRQ
jgi:hexosaminidase